MPLQALCFGDIERPVQLRVLHRGVVLGIIQMPFNKLLARDRESFHLEVVDEEGGLANAGKRMTNGKITVESIHVFTAGDDLQHLQGSQLPNFQVPHCHFHLD